MCIVCKSRDRGDNPYTLLFPSPILVINKAESFGSLKNYQKYPPRPPPPPPSPPLLLPLLLLSLSLSLSPLPSEAKSTIDEDTCTQLDADDAFLSTATSRRREVRLGGRQLAPCSLSLHLSRSLPPWLREGLSEPAIDARGGPPPLTQHFHHHTSRCHGNPRVSS